MKKIYFLFFALIAFTASAQNQLSNASFETWTDDLPDNWYGDRSSIAMSRVSQSADAQNGSASVNLVNESNSHKRFTNTAISATNESYTLTYYAKGNGEIRNAFHDGGYSSYESYTLLSEANGWTLITYEFTPDAGSLEVIFSIRNTDAAGILVDNVMLHKTSTLSADDHSLNTFSIFPNPTSTGFVNIVSAHSEAISVNVYDMLGKQVINETIANNRLNVSTLNAGVYIMKISQGNTTTTKRFVVK